MHVQCMYASFSGVDFKGNPWVADAQINRRDTKFWNLGICLGYQILTIGLIQIYILNSLIMTDLVMNFGNHDIYYYCGLGNKRRGRR
jgi:hypothetical protein